MGSTFRMSIAIFIRSRASPELGLEPYRLVSGRKPLRTSASRPPGVTKDTKPPRFPCGNHARWFRTGNREPTARAPAPRTAPAQTHARDRTRRRPRSSGRPPTHRTARRVPTQPHPSPPGVIGSFRERRRTCDAIRQAGTRLSKTSTRVPTPMSLGLLKRLRKKEKSAARAGVRAVRWHCPAAVAR
jgi:hypothetical protein